MCLKIIEILLEHLLYRNNAQLFVHKHACQHDSWL